MVSKNKFGTVRDSAEVYEYTITAGQYTASVITLGATLLKFRAPDKNGTVRDVIVGFDDLDTLLKYTDYNGVIAGQYANRIAGGEFTLNGQKIALEKNEKGKTTLHGAGEYSGALWDAQIIGDKAVAFTYNSPDMERGFPGNVKVKVVYSLADNGELAMDYTAVSDKATVINLTNHAYFNLNGYGSGDVLDHVMQIQAQLFTPIDADSIPTGELAPVKGTPFTFTEPKKIGTDINSDCVQIKNGSGYDHNFCIDDWDGALRRAATVYSPQSGICLTVSTTLPGIQFYSGNFLKGNPGKAGSTSEHRAGFCLETQYYPDTPNHPDFPQCFFAADEPYTSRTVYALSTI